MKMADVKKLKKGDKLKVQGAKRPCSVLDKDDTRLSFTEEDPEGTGVYVTGIVNWPVGEDEIDFPKPTVIKRVLS